MGGVSPYWTEYGYDSLGNRKSETRHGLNGAATSTRSYVYGDGSGPNGTDSGPHTVSSVTQKTDATATTPQITSQNSYTYDASGNTATRVLDGDTQSLAWDKQGELTTVTNADATVTTYKYDASGSRILRDTPDEKTFYLPGTELHYDKSTAKVTATRYYSFADHGRDARGGRRPLPRLGQPGHGATGGRREDGFDDPPSHGRVRQRT